MCQCADSWTQGRSSDGDHRWLSATAGCGPGPCIPPGTKYEYVYKKIMSSPRNENKKRRNDGMPKTDSLEMQTFCPLGPVQQLASCHGRYILSASQACRAASSWNEQNAQELQSTSRPSSQRRVAYCSGPHVLHGAHTVLLLRPQAVAM